MLYHLKAFIKYFSGPLNRRDKFMLVTAVLLGINVGAHIGNTLHPEEFHGIPFWVQSIIAGFAYGWAIM